MPTLVIVDDEPLVRLALHRMIDWSALGISIAGEAGDGAEALELLRRLGGADLLLVDIEMPRMGGIALLRELAGGENRLPVTPLPVVLSAYSDYGYVREAFVLGALDYIVKADMDEEHILPVMAKALAALRSAAPQHAAEQAELDAQKARESRSRTEERLRSLLRGETDGLPEELSLSGMAGRSPINAAVAIVDMADPAADAERQGFVRQTMETVLSSLSIRHEICRMEEGEYAVLISLAEERSSAAVHSRVHAAMGTIQARLSSYVNAQAAIGICYAGQATGGWSGMYNLAAALAGMSYYDGFGQLYDMERYGRFLRLETREQGLPLETAGARRELAEALDCASPEPWQECFVQLRRLLSGARSVPPAVMQSCLGDLLWEAGSLLYKRGRRWEELPGAGGSPGDVLRRCRTLEEAMAAVRFLLEGLHSLLHDAGKRQLRYSEPIAVAKEWLDLHFREEISQSLVSGLAGVSESYLSKQFAKEVGVNFLHYLTSLRMEEAKRLLEQGARIADVSEAIGYVNPEHFSRLFKKVTGMSPKGYRNKLSEPGLSQFG